MIYRHPQHSSIFLRLIFLAILLTVVGSGCQRRSIPAEQGEFSRSYVVYLMGGRLSSVESIPENPPTDERCRYYRLPQEAVRFLTEVEFEQMNEGHSQSLYWSAKADSEFALLRANAEPGRRDFVSDYNFLTASLDDLPFSMIAEAGITSRQWIEFVEKLKAQIVQLSAFEFPASWTVDEDKEFKLHKTPQYSEKDLRAARLIDGRFHGSIQVSDGVLSAVPEGADPYTSPLELRIHCVTFSDVDGDGYLDAGIRLGINGRGETIVLGRTHPDQRRFDQIR